MAKKIQTVTVYGNLGGDPKVHQIPRADRHPPRL